MAREHGVQNLPEVSPRGFYAVLSQCRKAVIDAAVIDQFPARQEYRGLGSDARVGFTNEHALRIAHSGDIEPIILRMFSYRLSCFIRIGVNQPEGCAARRVFGIDSADLRRVAIGDRTINANENKPDEFVCGRAEWDGNSR